MVFAAGFGTRMRPLTNTTPKPLLPVGQTCLLDHTIDLAQNAGVSRLVVNAHYLATQIENHLQDQRDVHVIVEDPILDTGGGLKNAAGHFDGPFVFTSNSDNIWAGQNPFSLLATQWKPHQRGLLLCAPVKKVIGRDGPGDFDIDPAGRVTRGGDFVFLGVQIISKEVVIQVPETVFSLNTVWDQLMLDGNLYGQIYDGLWCDVGRPENIQLAESLLKESRV